MKFFNHFVLWVYDSTKILGLEVSGDVGSMSELRAGIRMECEANAFRSIRKEQKYGCMCLDALKEP